MRLTYKQWRDLITRRLAGNRTAYKMALTELYHRTGGNKWLPEEHINGIIKGALAIVDNQRAIADRGRVILSTHEWGIKL